MKFKVRSRKTKRAEQSEWHKVFVWWPTRVGEEIVFLHSVMRRIVWTGTHKDNTYNKKEVFYKLIEKE